MFNYRINIVLVCLPITRTDPLMFLLSLYSIRKAVKKQIRIVPSSLPAPLSSIMGQKKKTDLFA